MIVFAFKKKMNTIVFLNFPNLYLLLWHQCAN